MRYKGKATVNINNLDSFAICDRCGQRWNHSKLAFQYDWCGPRLQNLRLLVCQRCMDVPFEHWRPIIVPPDPVPIANPRPFDVDSMYEDEALLTQDGFVITAQDGAPITILSGAPIIIEPLLTQTGLEILAQDGATITVQV